jgi:hypothetical protein
MASVTAEVGAQPRARVLRNAGLRHRLVEEPQARLIEVTVVPVAGVPALHGRLGAVAAGVEGRATGRLGQVRRQPLVVLRVQSLLEGMDRLRVGQAQLVPPHADPQDRVESAEVSVKGSPGSPALLKRLLDYCLAEQHTQPCA